jgi:hypothetical protein
MTAPIGKFTGSNITLVLEAVDSRITPPGSDANSFLNFLNAAVAESTGKATVKNGDTELACTFTYAKNLLTVTDPSGNKSTFAFANNALYFLDPTGNSSMILRKA